MVRITAFAILAFAASTFALTPDPAGAANQGNGAGKQFIGGACNNNADCASACCAAQSDGTQPVCSGPGAQFQVGKLGCGSAEGGQSSAPPQAPPQAPPAGVVNPVAPANPASGGAAAGGITPDPAGAKNQGNGAGKQFIGGACNNNADCASACCAAQSNGAQSVCSGPGAQFQAGKLGCGSAGKRAVPVQW